MAIESGVARRELLHVFGTNFFGAKNEFLTCIKFHDQARCLLNWHIKDSKKENLTNLQLHLNGFSRNVF